MKVEVFTISPIHFKHAYLNTKKMQEEFKDVEGYEGLYQVSNMGNVKSLPRKICNIKRCYISKEKILKIGIEKHGYCLVVLFKNSNGKTVKVHKLVTMAFLNHKPCGHKLVINHKDFNKLNNNLNNLEIVTQRENANRKHLKSTSKFVGVSLDRGTKKWKAQIEINDKKVYLGLFNTELEAHEVYQNKLKTL